MAQLRIDGVKLTADGADEWSQEVLRRRAADVGLALVQLHPGAFALFRPLPDAVEDPFEVHAVWAGTWPGAVRRVRRERASVRARTVREARAWAQRVRAEREQG